MTGSVPGAVALILAGLEVMRGDRRHLAARLTALGMLLAGLALLLGEEQPAAVPGQVTILTPGAPEDASGFRLDDGRPRSASTIATLGALGDTLESAQEVVLRGWGLLPHEWSTMPAVPVRFEAESLPQGIVALEAPRAIGLGELVQVSGRAQLADGDSGWIHLTQGAVSADSAVVSARRPEFTLRDRPRALGTLEYGLVLRVGRVEVAETLGVAVLERAMPRVLVLEGSPSFETGFLKRWLGASGGRLSIRTQVSRARFRSEHVNGEGPPLTPLTAEALESFDLIVADGAALASAGGGEPALIRRAVERDGVGLLIVPGTMAGVTAMRGLFPGVELRGRGEEPYRLARPRWREQARRPPVGLNVEAGVLVAPGTEPLLADEDGAALAVRRPAGRGAVGLTLVAAPSRWLLDGDRDLYGGYWSQLIPRIARDTASRLTIESDAPLRAGRPATLLLLTRDTLPRLEVRAASGAADRIALERDPLDPRRWRGRYWPREAGWHSATMNGTSRLAFRVNAAHEWLGVEAAARLEATRSRFSAARLAPAAATAPRRAALLPLAFLLLLLGTSYLWYEHRRRG